MFKKKPQIKNLAPLRSSDRRKLADQVISDYSIPIPPQQAQVGGEQESNATLQSQSNLSTIRSSLLPETTSSARFTTTAGANSTLVSGTIYVGAHPGQDERILWIQYGKDPRLIPTVYSLWHNANIVPLLHTQDFVANEKLVGGADLMIPGLVKSPGTTWDERARKGSLVAVAGMTRNTVPVWIGTCEIDVCALGDDIRGQKGVAVKGVHWEGDELWNWSSVAKGGKPSPDALEGWNVDVNALEQDVAAMNLQDDEEEDENGEGGALLETSTADLKADASSTNGHRDAGDAGDIDEEDDDQAEEHEPTTAEVDHAFFQAFLYSLHTAKKNNAPPSYGFDFPLQPSYLISNMVQPYLRHQTQHFAIKKTSWKNTKKFIKYLDKSLLVKSKDRNGGETVILDIDFSDQQIKDFVPYRLPQTKSAAEATDKASASADNGDSSLGQKLSIQTLHRASSKLVPQLLPSKTQYYTAQQVTTAIKAYIEANPDLVQNVSSARYIKINPFIANNILNSNPSPSDTKILAAREIARDVLARRIIDDDHLAPPHHIILRNGQTYDSNNISPDLKPKAGPPPKVHLTVEKRTGTKVVTRISNLEPFYINPQLLAPELQRKCAGSASVSQHVGGKPGMLEIVVQGDQRDILTRDVLSKRGVDSRWVVIDDKTKKKGKK